MISIYADFNNGEKADGVGIRLDIDLNSKVSEQDFYEGLRVLLYDETVEVEATLERGTYYTWVGILDRSTIRHLPPEEYSRLD